MATSPQIQKGCISMKPESIFSLWPILPFGAEEGDGAANSNAGDGGANSGQPANQQANQGDSGQDQGKQGSDTDDDEDPYAGLSAKELKRLLADTEKGKKTSDAEKKQLQDKIDAENRKKNDETTNLKNDLDAEKTTTSQLRQALRTQTLVNAILLDDRFTWHSIDDVIFKLGDSVNVSDEGKVEGLTRALTAVAKDNEYLVKSRKDQQDSKQNNQQQHNGPTGFQPGQGGANQGGALPPNASDLAKTFPALANRISGYAPPAAPQPMSH